MSPIPTTTPNNLNAMPLNKSLMVMRIIWAALIIGQLAFLTAVTVIISQPPAQKHDPAPLLAYVSFFMLVSTVPAMFLMRTIVFRKNRVDGILPPASYSTGNIMFWAGCEGAAFFAMIAALINRSLWPTIVVVLIALALQALTFPMRSQIQRPGGVLKVE